MSVSADGTTTCQSVTVRDCTESVTSGTATDNGTARRLNITKNMLNSTANFTAFPSQRLANDSRFRDLYQQSLEIGSCRT